MTDYGPGVRYVRISLCPTCGRTFLFPGHVNCPDAQPPVQCLADRELDTRGTE